MMSYDVMWCHMMSNDVSLHIYGFSVILMYIYNIHVYLCILDIIWCHMTSYYVMWCQKYINIHKYYIFMFFVILLYIYLFLTSSDVTWHHMMSCDGFYPDIMNFCSHEHCQCHLMSFGVMWCHMISYYGIFSISLLFSGIFDNTLPGTFTGDKPYQYVIWCHMISYDIIWHHIPYMVHDVIWHKK